MVILRGTVSWKYNKLLSAVLPLLGEVVLLRPSIIISLQAKPKSPIRTWQSWPWRKMFLGCGKNKDIAFTSITRCKNTDAGFYMWDHTDIVRVSDNLTLYSKSALTLQIYFPLKGLHHINCSVQIWNFFSCISNNRLVRISTSAKY